VLIAREFEKDPKVLVVAQPTRGVDVGAIEFINSRILKAREDGVAVLLVSSELDEILQLADRILVFFSGQVVAEFVRGEADEKKIGNVMGGGKVEELRV
jgi:simple sugar transport system ATP-binding protein